MSNKTQTDQAVQSDPKSGAPATPTLPPARPPKKTEMQLRVEYTRDEIVGLARKLAESTAELSRAEEDKKAVTAQLKAICDSISASISELTGKINSGFEYRVTPCEVRYDDPKPNLKSTVRLDTGDVVNVEPMTLSERQAELPLTGESKPGASSPVVLKVEDFDLKSEQIHPAGFEEEECGTAALLLREIFIDDETDELRSDELRKERVADIVNDETPSVVEGFLRWLRADRQVALPGADQAIDLLVAAMQEHRERTFAKAQAKPKGRKVTPGTVECPADEGSRDDAGAEGKNDL